MVFQFFLYIILFSPTKTFSNCNLIYTYITCVKSTRDGIASIVNMIIDAKQILNPAMCCFDPRFTYFLCPCVALICYSWLSIHRIKATNYKRQVDINNAFDETKHRRHTTAQQPQATTIGKSSFVIGSYHYTPKLWVYQLS